MAARRCRVAAPRRGFADIERKQTVWRAVWYGATSRERKEREKGEREREAERQGGRERGREGGRERLCGVWGCALLVVAVEQDLQPA